MDTKKILSVYMVLLFIASAFVSIPVKYREIFCVIAVVFSGPFMMGYFQKSTLLTLVINVIYFPLGMYLPRWVEDAIPGKMETDQHVAAVFCFSLVGLIAGIVMLYAGKKARYIVDTYGCLIQFRKPGA